MTDEIDDLEVDRRVRHAFSPSDDAVRRVIQRSIPSPGDPPTMRRSRLSVRVALATLTIAIVTAAIWVGRGPRAEFRVIGEGSRVVIQMPDGQKRVLNADDKAAGREHLIIVVQR